MTDSQTRLHPSPIQLLGFLLELESTADGERMLSRGSDFSNEAARHGWVQPGRSTEFARRMWPLFVDGLVTWRENPAFRRTSREEWDAPDGDAFYNFTDIRLTGAGRTQALLARSMQASQGAASTTVSSSDAPAAVGRGSFEDMPEIDREQLGIDTLDVYADRIRRSLDADPEETVCHAKDLLESTVKHVVVRQGGTLTASAYMPVLAREAINQLPMPEDIDEKGSKAIQKLLGSLNGAVTALAELRNAHGAGHGGLKVNVVRHEHARFAAGASLSVARLLVLGHASGAAEAVPST